MGGFSTQRLANARQNHALINPFCSNASPRSAGRLVTEGHSGPLQRDDASDLLGKPTPDRRRIATTTRSSSSVRRIGACNGFVILHDEPLLAAAQKG